MQIYHVIHAKNEKEIENEQAKHGISTYNARDFLINNKDTVSGIANEIAMACAAKAIATPSNLVKVVAEMVTPIRVDDILDTRLMDKIELLCNTLLEDASKAKSKIKVLSLNEAKIEFPKSKGLSVGMYTLHPNDGKRLTLLEGYHNNLAMEKDDELIKLLGAMGAKSITIREKGEEKRSGHAEVGMDQNGVGGKVAGGGKNGEDKGKELKVEFEGNTVDIDPELLEKSLWYQKDGQMKAIFDSRRFSGNRMLSYTLKNTYKESFGFDFAAAANWVGGSANLKADYESLCSKERFFTVEFSK